MNTELQKNITDTFNELDNIIFAFNDTQLNIVPFKGSWTAGQVADHIIKSLSGLTGLMNGPTEKTEREPGEKIKALEDLFLNFDIKMKSPDFILPSDDIQERDAVLHRIQELKNDMLNANNLDLSLLCLGAEFPGFGQMTRLEWIHFFLVHTQRHTQQVKNIFQKLK